MPLLEGEQIPASVSAGHVVLRSNKVTISSPHSAVPQVDQTGRSKMTFGGDTARVSSHLIRKTPDGFLIMKPQSGQPSDGLKDEVRAKTIIIAGMTFQAKKGGGIVAVSESAKPSGEAKAAKVAAGGFGVGAAVVETRDPFTAESGEDLFGDKAQIEAAYRKDLVGFVSLPTPGEALSDRQQAHRLDAAALSQSLEQLEHQKADLEKNLVQIQQQVAALQAQAVELQIRAAGDRAGARRR